MKIIDIQLFQYDIPLKHKLVLKKTTLRQRTGFIIKIVADDSVSSVSEIAPLPSFSRETDNDVVLQVKEFSKDFKEKQIPKDILSYTADLFPSVQFGIESALLNLTAASKNLTLQQLLNPNADSVVSLNALLMGSKDEILIGAEQLYEHGYRAFKIKVGRLPIKDEVEIVKTVRKIVGENSVIRLDANQNLKLIDAVNFFKQIEPCLIDYIEEPFHSLADTQKYINHNSQKVPIALDESLQLIRPDQISKYSSVKALVLKPTLLGYTNTMSYAREAIRNRMQSVISSSFETSVGIYFLASMAAIIDSSIPVGLDTLGWFQKDIVEKPIKIKNGQIDLKDYKQLLTQVDYSQLKEVELE